VPFCPDTDHALSASDPQASPLVIPWAAGDQPGFRVRAPPGFPLLFMGSPLRWPLTPHLQSPYAMDLADEPFERPIMVGARARAVGSALGGIDWHAGRDHLAMGSPCSHCLHVVFACETIGENAGEIAPDVIDRAASTRLIRGDNWIAMVWRRASLQ